MSDVNRGPRRSNRASTILALVTLALIVTATPAAFAQSPGNTQRYQGPGTISGSIPTLPTSLPGNIAIAFDLGAEPTVFAFDIKASAAGQTVVFSAVSIRNVQITPSSAVAGAKAITPGTDFDVEFRADLETSLNLGGNLIHAQTEGRILFAGTIHGDGTGHLESQGEPMQVIVNGNPVGPITKIETELQGTCSDTLTQLCLNDGRFAVQIGWNTGSETGMAHLVPFGSNDSGLFYFFAPDNWEMLLKVLDSCSFNDRFWVFAAATTDVEYTITVTDTDNGTQKQYFNPLRNAAPAITDTEAFATCP